MLVDEADTDAVVGRDTASAPQLSCGSGVSGCSETGELRTKPDGHTVCDLVGERRDRILRLVEAFHRNQVPDVSDEGVLAWIVADKRLHVDHDLHLSDVNSYYPCIESSEMWADAGQVVRK